MALIPLAATTQTGSTAWIAIGWVSLALAFVCAGAILWDVLVHGDRSEMAIMNWVWPITALYWGPVALYFFRTRERERGGWFSVAKASATAAPAARSATSSASGSSTSPSGSAFGFSVMITATFGALSAQLLHPGQRNAGRDVPAGGEPENRGERGKTRLSLQHTDLHPMHSDEFVRRSCRRSARVEGTSGD